MPSNGDQSELDRPAEKDDFLIVGIGASAGGIQALSEFFRQVPKDSGIAYVVILHMSPEHESKLAEVLQSTALIPVTQVRQGVKVEPNHVYVIPPKQNLTMTDGHLKLTNMIGVEERRSPVDLFFRTLAETNESRAASVILSGTGSDGSMGLKRIKEHGGVALVQEPTEAQYADMPRNAIATGLVDVVLPAAEIPRKLLLYSQQRSSILISDVKAPSANEEAVGDIFAQLRMTTGHDFSNYRRGTMLRRIGRRLAIKELSGLPEYAKYLRENRQEAQALMRDLLISVTNFFRDPASIDALAQTVLPAIISRKKGADDDLRVWIPGCATGEEAYTLAILVREKMAHIIGGPRIQIFATDLDAAAIAVAREGHYSEAEVADISPERLHRFFMKEQSGYRVRREVQETILFAVHNVIKEPPFSHLDLISCRNLLIYLNRMAQNQFLEVMHFALNPAGYLFLGSAESIDTSNELFSTVDKDHHIYQCRPAPTRAAFAIPDIPLRPVSPSGGRERTAHETLAIDRLSYVDLHQRLLEEFAPPSVVVTEEYNIVHLSARAGQYLELAGGGPSNNLLKLVRPELRLDLRTALYQAVQNRVPVQSRSLRVATAAGIKTVRTIVRPVLGDGDRPRGFILVLFEEQKTSIEEPQNEAPNDPIARQLEDELMHSKSQLRATVEQYEIQQEQLRASNEELQAMNEELRSSAEELETSKEELQSVNEELITVNQELKIKIEELSQSNNDFTNLMNATNIGTIFLDRALCVKQFTQRARDVFNLIPSDTGRSLFDITHKLLHHDLRGDIERVTTTFNKVQHEVRTDDYRWYLMSLLPYRTSEHGIDGVVITFLDITESKVAKTELEDARVDFEQRASDWTFELQKSNKALTKEVAERRHSEVARMKLVSQLVSSQESERSRLARDLHDQLGQQLTALRLKLEAVKDRNRKRANLQQEIDELLGITTQLDADVDFLAWQLRPVVLEDLGLPEALQVYVRQWAQHLHINAEFHSVGFESERPSPEIENHLYRIAQEALNNVVKHSQASTVDILLERRGDHAVLIVEDNGVGFSADEQPPEGSHGLNGIRERASLLGGHVELESTAGKGTTIIVRVPVRTGAGD